MRHFLYASLIFGFIVAAGAQSYSPGLPLPGLPKSLGQKTMSASTSVTIASDQSPISITGSIVATNPSVGLNFSAAPTSSTQIGGIDSSGNLQPVIIGPQGITVSARIPNGVAITNTPTVNQGTNPWVVAGGVAITAPATVLQGTNPWIDSIPNGVAITNTPTVNQGTNPWVTSRTWVLQGSSDSVGITGTVTALQGNAPWAITGTVSSSGVTVTSSTITRVANSLASQSLLVANGNRKQVFFFNDGTTANCYVKFGSVATATSFTIKMFPTDTYIMDPPVYTGAIDYICDVASGSMEVNEQ